jgi:hypothetical protein
MFRHRIADRGAGAWIWFGKARFLALAAALAGLAAAAGWCIRVGWADYWAREQTVAGTEKALRATPDQAAYYVQLAALVSENNPARSTEALERAVALDPSDSPSWIELSRRAEASGRDAAAEHYLRRAAEEDKQYLPRWALANYYFRRRDTDKFWYWAKGSADMIYSDPSPLFRLCGKVAEDGNLIDRLQIGKPDVRARYLSYLLEQGRLDLIGPATRRLLEEQRESDVSVLMAACDRLLEGKRGSEALEIWNRLAATHRIQFGRLAPARGLILTNGNFAVAPTSHGFDWRLAATEGSSASREENPMGLRLAFSGRQSENYEILSQFLPVMQKTGYELKVVYRTSGIATETGLGWRVQDAARGRTLAEGASLSSESEAQGRFRFITPAGCRLARLTLAYRRAPGTTRIEGFIILRDMELNPSAQEPSGEPSRSRVRK